MATDANEIGQLALGYIGDDSTVADIVTSPSTRQDIILKRFYSLALDHCLEEHPWKFASRKTLLTIHDGSDDDADLEGEWEFAFNIPASTLRVMKVLLEGATKSVDGQDFDIYTEADGTTLLLTNVSLDETYADLIYQVTDTTKFPSHFTMVLSLYLAHLTAPSFVAGTKGQQLADTLYNRYLREMARAIAMDQRQEQIEDEYKSRYPKGILSER